MERHPSSTPHPLPAPALPLVWCLLSAALFGASTPASKLLLGSIDAIVLSGLLYLGGALAVAPWAVPRRAALRAIDRRNWLHLLGAVIAGCVLGPALLLFTASIDRFSPSQITFAKGLVAGARLASPAPALRPPGLTFGRAWRRLSRLKPPARARGLPDPETGTRH